jgi:hypothetical protein
MSARAVNDALGIGLCDIDIAIYRQVRHLKRRENAPCSREKTTSSLLAYSKSADLV